MSTSATRISSSSSNLSIGVLISAIRAKHWIKNVFVFTPLLFSQNLLDLNLLSISSLAFLSFNVIASSVYLLNDVFDYKKDREHPVKKYRPIASGKLKIPQALMLSSLLLLGGLSLSLVVGIKFTLVILGYLGLNILYSSYLKHQVILDVFVLSSFYILRVLAGGFAIEVQISNWLLICTFLLALFMGFGKRRHELTLLKDEAKNHRAILSEYSPYFLDQVIAVVTPSTLITYLMYTMSPETIDKFHTNKLPVTMPFVLYGIFRYLYLVHQKNEGGNPTNLMLEDKPLLLTVISWAMAVFIIIYLN